jgi:mannosyl-oligosaccharide alpha-1,2-mannosidase
VPDNVVTRRTVLAALAAAGGLSLAGGLTGPAFASATTAGRLTPPPAPVAAGQIRAEFLHAWRCYQRFAWGHDEVHPLSGGFDEFFVPGHPIGLSIIEALDTLYVMELDDDLATSVQWLKANLDFDIDGDFHVFEAIIRVVGGLLAGYLATHDKRLLDLTVDVTDRLLPAFTESPTGMPYQFVNFHTGAVSGTTPPLAEIGTNILEFGVLSRLTGDPKYFQAAKKAYRFAVAQRSSIDLMATNLNVETGEWADSTDQAPNPPVDSFYEYLWGGWPPPRKGTVTPCQHPGTKHQVSSSRESTRGYRGTSRPVRSRSTSSTTRTRPQRSAAVGCSVTRTPTWAARRRGSARRAATSIN